MNPDSDTRIKEFARYVERSLAVTGIAELFCDGSGHTNSIEGLPGITQNEATALAGIFIKNGCHAKAWYLDINEPKFWSVIISHKVLVGHKAKIAYSEVWG